MDVARRLVLVRHERAARIRRRHGPPVVARQHGPDREAHDAFDVFLADVRARVVAAHDRADAVLAVPLAQQRGDLRRAAHGRQLLVDHERHRRHRLDRVDACRGPTAADRERRTDSSRPADRGACADAGRPPAAAPDGPARRARPCPALARHDQGIAGPRRRADATFSSASTTENRGSTPRNSAASPWPVTCKSAMSTLAPGSAASAAATLTASVVVPTPPLAPTKRQHLALLDAGACWPSTRSTAARRSAARHRLRHDLVHARAHGVEHHGGIELRHDDDDARAGEAALERHQLRRNAQPEAQVHHQHVGRRPVAREGREPVDRIDRHGVQPGAARQGAELTGRRFHNDNTQCHKLLPQSLPNQNDGFDERQTGADRLPLRRQTHAGQRHQTTESRLACRCHALDKEAHDVRDGHCRPAVVVRCDHLDRDRQSGTATMRGLTRRIATDDAGSRHRLRDPLGTRVLVDDGIRIGLDALPRRTDLVTRLGHIGIWSPILYVIPHTCLDVVA